MLSTITVLLSLEGRRYASRKHRPPNDNNIVDRDMRPLSLPISPVAVRGQSSPGVSHLGQAFGQSDQALQLPGRGADCLRSPAHHVAHVEVPLDQGPNCRLAYLDEGGTTTRKRPATRQSREKKKKEHKEGRCGVITC